VKASTAAAWLAAGLAGLAAASPARAQGPVELSRSPIAENAAWKSYVLGTGTADVAPVRIASVSGQVTNAEGLVDPAKGPATLTFAAGGPAPVIVLDYGREVGGLPFFTAGAVTPAGTGTSVTLRSAYSETREFLYTAGSTTLSLPAAAGDTNLKVAGVGNFIVGDTLRIGSQTATITAVGTQARSTTLFAAAAAGATNVKVAATTGLAAGDALRVDGENVTIASVGTQGRTTTLSAAAAAGATNVKLASVTGMAAGDPIVVDGESGTIETSAQRARTAPA
jgi:alpha-L-rhamnosidase